MCFSDLETNFYVHPFYGVLLGYQAVKQDNIGICESGQAPGVVDRCRETYEEYINDLYLAQLKCGKIDKSVENAKILCNALKAGKCPEDSSPDLQSVCTAILSKDDEVLFDALQSGNINYSRQQAMEAFFVYLGYKNKSIEQCQLYAKELAMERKYSCSILLSDDPDIFKSVVKDFALMHAALMNGLVSSVYCENIQDEMIKDHCISRDFTILSEEEDKIQSD